MRCTSRNEQPAWPAADDTSPDLQEHTKLAGKRLLLAAAVNKLPYAPVGVSAQPTHFSNIQYTEIL